MNRWVRSASALVLVAASVGAAGTVASASARAAGAAASVSSDFNGDGFADLAIGVPFEDIDTGGGAQADAGAITVVYGARDGLTATGAQGLNQGNTGVGAAIEEGDMFGFELASLPLGNSPQADLVMGDELEDIGATFDAGAVFAMFGSSTGLTTANAETWNADTAGVPGTAIVGGRFGASVA